MTLFLQQLVNGIAVGSLYGIFAVGFGLVEAGHRVAARRRVRRTAAVPV
jgi:branched-subunit amino acid ABC-type transport system permease component